MFMINYLRDVLNLKKLWEKTKASPIGSGLIASFIFLIIFEPLLDFAAINIPLIVSAVSSALVNFIYARAATMTLNKLVLYALVALFSYYVTTNIIKTLAAKPMLPAENNIGSEPPAHQDGEMDVAKELENLENQIIDVEKRIDILIEKRRRLDQVLWWVNLAMIVLLAMYVLLVFVIPFTIHVSFQDAILLIAPHTDDATIKELISKWAQMKNHSDYKEIAQAINDIRSAAGI